MTRNELIAFGAGVEQGRRWVEGVKSGGNGRWVPTFAWNDDRKRSWDALGDHGFEQWRKRGYVSVTSDMATS